MQESRKICKRGFELTEKKVAINLRKGSKKVLLRGREANKKTNMYLFQQVAACSGQGREGAVRRFTDSECLVLFVT